MSERSAAFQGGSSMCGPTVVAGLHPIRLRAALATPSAWVDAIVTSISGDRRTAALHSLDGRALLVAGGPEAIALLTVGAPVAVHRLYEVLATGEGYAAISAAA